MKVPKPGNIIGFYLLPNGEIKKLTLGISLIASEGEYLSIPLLESEFLLW